MDAIDLLAREDEFKRLNKQLEKKTESLMKEIEHVMQKQDFFAEFSPSLATPTRQNYKKHCCTPPSQPDTPIRNNKKKPSKLESPKSLESEDSDFESKSPNKNGNSEFESKISNKNRKEFENKKWSSKKVENQNIIVCDCFPPAGNKRNDDLEFLYAFVNVNVKDKVLPPSFSKEDKVSVESVCKFLSAKIKLMQEQIDKLQSTIEKKASQCESHLTQLAELESERMTLLNRTNSMKCSTADMRAKYLATQKRLEEKERQYKDHRSEIDRLSCELKRLKSRNATVEAKYAAQELATDNLRQQLDLSRRSEKEHRDAARQLSSAHDSAVSRLSARVRAQSARGDQLAALAHNLRAQNALLAAGGAVHTLTAEYKGWLDQEFE